MASDKKKKRYPYVWAVIYGVLLVGYGVFALLDAFVLPRNVVYLNEVAETSLTEESDTTQQTAASEEVTQTTDVTETEEAIVTDTSYESENISISISTIREYDTQIYIADVVIKDISYLKAGLADGAFGRNVNEKTSVMAEENNAILAINGDYYGFREDGFVLRNGYLYRDTAREASDDDALVIHEDGELEIVSENSTNVQELADTAVQIFSFGPGLISNGEILVDESNEVEQAMRSNPRTAIGQISPLHYIFVVSDGRTDESEGLSLLELAQVMQEQGCQTAYNLDGGGSSTMWFMGEVVNQPTDGRKSGERSVSDIIYIGE